VLHPLAKRIDISNAAAAADNARSADNAAEPQLDLPPVSRGAVDGAALALAFDEFADVTGDVAEQKTQRDVRQADGEDHRQHDDGEDDDRGHTST